MAKAKAGASARNPWIKWFTRDWRADPPLRMCSYSARGLWADLLSLMAESRHFGFLLIEGVNPTNKQLAGLLGGSEKEVAKLKGELGEANVYSVTGAAMPDDVAALIPDDMPDGVILSRRMVRDKAKADRDAQNGKGGGNPNLRGLDNRGVNPHDNPQKPEGRGQKADDVTTTPSVRENARKRATLITADWLPKPETVAELRKGRPDLVGETYEAELREFQLWCRSNAVTSHDPEASFLRFMNKARVSSAQRETFDQRRIREGLKAIGAA